MPISDPLTRYNQRHVKDPDTGCWNWTRPLGGTGYATLSIRGQQTYVHRWAYEQFVGPIPRGHDIHHTCENRACVNPAHMTTLPRTTHTSIHPRHKRVRERPACSRGHLYTPENTRRDKSRGGARVCRICQRERVRRHYDKHLRSTDQFNQPRRAEPGGPIDHRASD